MAPLSRELRRDLANKVTAARRVAEDGARKAIEGLAVHSPAAWPSSTSEERKLRNRLRAHGRQLGDKRDSKSGAQAVNRLVTEVAYQYWHGMLFGRFLAENDLLLMPGTETPISLAEAEEIARDERRDWLAVVIEYAERMLPQIFRSGDPALEVSLPPETRSALEEILRGLDTEVFTASDSLGWVYQFWQADKKDEVNTSEVKIGADELPAVTQLFTEDYMVLFLLHNTLGAWWADKVLADRPELARTAKTEEELRTACRVGDVEWSYLRFVREYCEKDGGDLWRPAARVAGDWPMEAKAITIVDPCMGSGHFLVFALSILVALRMAEENLSLAAATDSVLKANLFGLEIDSRCTQIAAFNLAFAAWRLSGYRPLPKMNIACSGLAIGVTKVEWLKLAEKAVSASDPGARRDLLGVEHNLLTHGLEDRVKSGLEALFDLFATAPSLGSLIDPRQVSADIFREGFEKLGPLLGLILSADDADETQEMAVAAQGLAKAAEILASRFTLAITNVPFLGNRRQSRLLLEFSQNFFERSKIDLSATMLDRIISAGLATTVATISPQAWLQQVRYRKFLEQVVFPRKVHLVLRYGSGAFQTISGEVVSVCATIITTTCEPLHSINALDLGGVDGAMEKAQASRVFNFAKIQTGLMREKRTFLFGTLDKQPAIGAIAFGTQGVKTGDDERFVRRFWEVQDLALPWRPYLGTASSNDDFAGRSSILRWENDGAALIRSRRDNAAFDRVGVAVNQMGQLQTYVYTGEAFDSNVAPIVCHDPGNTPALLAYLRSDRFLTELRKLESGMKINNGTLLRVPFDLDYWREIAADHYPDGLPKPHSSDPTQWLYDGHPGLTVSWGKVDSDNATGRSGGARSLQVAVARLLGYKWPRQTGVHFHGCAPLEVDDLDKHADDDGIVCLAGLKGEPRAGIRLNALLADAFGANWSSTKLSSLLAEVGYAGKSIDEWLRDGFFAQHCEMFLQRPFIWHIWDGRRDGFHALVNYHRLAAPNGGGRRTLEKLIYTYLGDWIDRQRADQKADVDGADARLAHAEYLKAELIKIAEGEVPYDIFVRWKPLRAQAIGWEPELDDGVRMNIRPFMKARPFQARAKGACILRATPRIDWDKDRGKEPHRDKGDYPWFWGWDGESKDFAGGAMFDGARWNDLHYSLASKTTDSAKRKGSA